MDAPSNADGTPLTIYTKHEAAEILRVSVGWLERRAATRRIPFALLGGEYRFTPEHLAEIVRINEHQPRAVPPLARPVGKSRSLPQQPAARPNVTPLRARPLRRSA